MKILCKECMKGYHRDIYVTLYSRKSISNSDNNLLDQSEGEALIFKHYTSWSNKKPYGLKKCSPKFNSSTSKVFNTERKLDAEMKEDPKCFNCWGTDHFAKECKFKEVDTNEDYKVKYKNPLASLKRKNINVKVIVVEEENWVDGEKSYVEDKEKERCLIFFIDEGTYNPSTFEVGLAKATKDSKMLETDSSSLYQVKKICQLFW